LLIPDSLLAQEDFAALFKSQGLALSPLPGRFDSASERRSRRITTCCRWMGWAFFPRRCRRRVRW
jgi:hypothetical protein